MTTVLLNEPVEDLLERKDRQPTRELAIGAGVLATTFARALLYRHNRPRFHDLELLRR
jgi:hypothetical protein